MLLDQKQKALLSWFSYIQGTSVSKELALQASGTIDMDNQSKYFLLNSLIALGLIDYTYDGRLTLTQSMILQNKGKYIGINIPANYCIDHLAPLQNNEVAAIQENTSIQVANCKPMAWLSSPNIKLIIDTWELYDLQQIDLNSLDQLTNRGWSPATSIIDGVYRFKDYQGSYILIFQSGKWYKLPSNRKEPYALDLSFLATTVLFDKVIRINANSKNRIEIDTYLFPPILLRLLIHSVFFDCFFSNGYGKLILAEKPRKFSLSKYKNIIL